VIEGTARSTPCHQCGGEIAIVEHAAERYQDELLRVVRGLCQRCHAPRVLWFRIGQVGPN
jgi:hypothetical protein